MTASASPAWALVQLAELVRRAEQLHLAALHVLPSEAGAEIPESAIVTVSVAEVDGLAAFASEAAEIAEHVRHLAQALPDGEVRIAYPDVHEAAAAELAQGILDPERVLVAARVLDVATGWPALAEALRVVDIPAGWSGWAPRGMLSAFRGADGQLVARALALAEIPPETGFADCAAEQLGRLADAIDELGRAWSP